MVKKSRVLPAKHYKDDEPLPKAKKVGTSVGFGYKGHKNKMVSKHGIKRAK